MHCHRLLRRHWRSLRRSVHDGGQRFCLYFRVDPASFVQGFRCVLREVPARVACAGVDASGMRLSERTSSGARSSSDPGSDVVLGMLFRRAVQRFNHSVAGFEDGRNSGFGLSASGSSVSGDPGGGGGGGGVAVLRRHAFLQQLPALLGWAHNRRGPRRKRSVRVKRDRETEEPRIQHLFRSPCNFEAELRAKCQLSFGGCSRAARSSKRSHLAGMYSCDARSSISAQMPS